MVLVGLLMFVAGTFTGFLGAVMWGLCAASSMREREREEAERRANADQKTE